MTSREQNAFASVSWMVLLTALLERNMKAVGYTNGEVLFGCVDGGDTHSDGVICELAFPDGQWVYS